MAHVTDSFDDAVASAHHEWTGGSADRFSCSIDGIVLKSGDVIYPQRAGVTVFVGANNSGKSTILREVVETLKKHRNRITTPTLSVDRLALSTTGTIADQFAWLRDNASFSFVNGRPIFRRHGVEATPGVLAQQFALRNEASPGVGELAGFICFYGNAEGRFSIGGSAEMRESVDDAPSHPVHHLQDSAEVASTVSHISEQVFRKPLTVDALARTVRLRVGKVEGEVPRVNDVPRSYRDEMAALPPLDRQGDGMRGFFGQVLPVVTATYPIIVLDEPEAFLHPPQAHALGQELGRLAVSRGIQILVATHDRSLLTGLLDSGVDVSVVRTSRDSDDARVFQLDSSELRELWNDPVLKYSNVLDGLFHRLVVITEAENDCAFLAAALDCPDRSASGMPANEILFVPSGGKAGMWKIASALKGAKVPVVAAPDLDIIAEEADIARLVQSLHGEWGTDMRRTWLSATSAQRAPRDPVRIGDVLSAINAALSGRSDEVYDADVRRELMAQARSRESPWTEVKMHGVDAFTGQARVDLGELLGMLEDVGVVPVHHGELERLAPAVVSRKGPGWLQEALGTSQQCNERTQSHVERILVAGERITSLQNTREAPLVP
ncbi:ATP-dependent nuclease [Microbacterium gilvum]|uniref:AAA+ ATPase domain-containing protein n=1 Tax=Microbacterium gilvum TaxID=1336204 RepID=A0ABP9AUS2_9MICO